MSAPKYKRHYPKESKSQEDDKKLIEFYKEKIRKKLQNKDTAKKMAQIIELMLLDKK